MPVTYPIVPQINLVLTTWTGDVTTEESLGLIQALRSDPDFHADMLQLSDANEARSMVSNKGVRSVALRPAVGPKSRRAIVVGDDAMYGVTRMYVSLAHDPGEIRIFRDRAEALSRLGIDPEVLPEDEAGC